MQTTRFGFCGEALAPFNGFKNQEIASCVIRIGCTRLISIEAKCPKPLTGSFEGEPLAPGGCQKLLKAGSKMPAPGQTRSMPPNSALATSNVFANWPQSVTSVFTNTALGPPPLALFDSMAFSASGVSLRSAITTLHPFVRSNAANSRLMPVCVS